ncbi:MAG: hypothetical protein PHS37_05470 [Candidatus Omnitrophica bacterium]|nr:hypothetical protein [Candidatus Omnitrophota bacterium]
MTVSARSIIAGTCIWFFIFILAAGYLYAKNKNLFEDKVWIGGDEGDYHNLGVNLSQGEGYRAGIAAACTFKDYRYAYYSVKIHEFTRRVHSYLHTPIAYSFLRSPGYPFYLAGVYSCVGIHPRTAKLIQVLMLAFMAACLPFIGWRYWKTTGFLSGCIAAWLFERYFALEPWRIMSEPLNIFMLTVWLLVFMAWERRVEDQRSFFWVGLMSGLVFFVRGSNFLIAVIAFIFMMLRQNTKKGLVRRLGLFLTGFFLIIGPWSVYASMHSGRFLLLNDQLGQLTLDGNNEDSISRGVWNPLYARGNDRQEGFFYNTPDIKPLPTALRVARFYRKHVSDLPQLFFNKLIAGFGSFYCYIILAMLLYYLVAVMARARDIPLFPAIFFITIFINTLVTFGCFRFTLVFMPFFLLPAVYLPLYAAGVAWRLGLKRRSLPEPVAK